MKKIFFLIICLFLSYPLRAVYHIAFVYVGPDIPAYIQDSIEQACLFNTQAELWLIGNKGAIEKDQELKEVLERNNVKLCYCEGLEKTTDHKDFIKKSILDTTFRQAFWLRTTERFFYLHEFIAQYNKQNVFHLENDVMLYTDLEEILPAFMKSGSMAAVFDNDIRCIPSFLYFKDSEAIEGLTSFIAQQATSGKNDMETLSQYRYVSKNVVGLPIIMKEYVDRYPLRNQLGNKAKHSHDYCENIDQFKGIFDAAALGQYLGG
ncbi:MAG: hypothetical protein WD068_03570, partial [Candidatus Babeliales bacterium]